MRRGVKTAGQVLQVATDMWVDVADMLEERQSFGAVTIGCVGLIEEQDLFDALIAKGLQSRA
jgi:hypothetical protein